MLTESIAPLIVPTFALSSKAMNAICSATSSNLASDSISYSTVRDETGPGGTVVCSSRVVAGTASSPLEFEFLGLIREIYAFPFETLSGRGLFIIFMVL